MTPETRVKEKFKKTLKLLEAHHGAAFWWTALSERYHSGRPDYLVIFEGEANFMEAKAEGEKLRPLQEWLAKKLIAAGARYWIITEEDGELCLIEKNGGPDPRATAKLSRCSSKLPRIKSAS